MRKMTMSFILLYAILICAPARAGVLMEVMIREAQALTGRGGAKGAILAVVEDGEATYASGFGWADESMNVASSDRTAFRIGSISKTFVAVAALSLAQQGLIDMSEDISVYLEPDFPAFERPVTMRMLLTHSAGYEDMVTGIAVPNVSDTQPLSVSIRRYRPAQSQTPGIVSYSNYGIALAAYVVERVAGCDFARFCRENIFLPLGMTRTTFEHMHDIAYVAKPSCRMVGRAGALHQPLPGRVRRVHRFRYGLVHALAARSGRRARAERRLQGGTPRTAIRDGGRPPRHGVYVESERA